MEGTFQGVISREGGEFIMEGEPDLSVLFENDKKLHKKNKSFFSTESKKC